MVDGFLVVDKPIGLSSHDVVGRVRRLFGTRKVGHTGTLDPFASGVLPVALGEATKGIQFLDEGMKRYQAELLLGRQTDSYDHTGVTTNELDCHGVNEQALLKVLDQFRGEQLQIPPMYSAVKKDGTPLYRLARKGIEIERAGREITIHALELIQCDFPKVVLDVVCSRGTYVRSLAHDIGLALGCGACLTALRRLASGPFQIEDALTLEEVAKRLESGAAEDILVPLEATLWHLPQVEMQASFVQRVRAGVIPRELAQALPAGNACLLEQGRIIAVASGDGQGMCRIARGFNMNKTA